MRNIKRYTLPIILGILSLALLVVGVLGATVWRPPQEVVAEHSTELPFTMTRGGVFRLYEDYQGPKDKISIVATAPGDETVWVALGTPEDVAAWLQNDSYDEIVGTADTETLKTVNHVVDQQPQSEPEPEPEGTEGEEAAEGEEAEVNPAESNPLASDMWTAVKYGRHSVSIALTGDEMDLSLLAATDGSGPAPTITIKWEAPQSNFLAIFAFAGAAGLALLALAAWAILFATRDRARIRRSHEIRENKAARSDETELIPVVGSVDEKIDSDSEDGQPSDIHDDDSEHDDRQEGDELEPRSDDDDGAAVGHDDEPVDDEPLGETPGEAVPETPSEAVPETPSEAVPETPVEAVQSEPEHDEDDEPAPDQPATDESEDEDPEPEQAEVGSSDGADDDHRDEALVTESVVDTEPEAESDDLEVASTDQAEATESVSEPAVEQVETVSTDSAMLNLSALQTGRAFPTRRALREAEARGVDALMVEGERFSTKTSEVPKLTEAQLEQHDDSTSVEEAPAAGRRSWTDILRGKKARPQKDSSEGEGE